MMNLDSFLFLFWESCSRPRYSARKNENMAASIHGSRKFFEVPSDYLSKQRDDIPISKSRKVKELFKYIDDNCIGRDLSFLGPYGPRKVIYCDYTASGRALKFIENYIQDQVLPHYGNTHTTTTVTALQTTLYRHEGRDVIRNAVNASESDAVIFTGSGCTGAIHKFIHALNLSEPPVVFMGPFAHHSSILPWKEAGADIIWIKQTSEGLVSLLDLKQKLKMYSSSTRSLIGCFAAASNVTGILTDTNTVSALLHRYGALACWDYATAGPYVEINMNPVVTSEDQWLVYKDAIFVSPHKFVGGVGTPGILVSKKRLFQNPVPSGCGGGSVFFVTENSHRYLQETETREEGGTPAIVESIRAGLVFQLKEAVGHKNIMEQEENLCRLAFSAWKEVPNIVLLGSKSPQRLPIFSFLIRHPESGLFLHFNYVSALLNDLFGVQSRGGCACAGPYAQDLLGMNEGLAMEYESLLLEDSRLDRVHLRRYSEYSEHETLRPGFVRLNLPYFMSDECVQYVLKAVTMVASHGWKLLPQYIFNPETAEWKHRRHKVFRDRKWLGSISYISGHMTYPVLAPTEGLPEDLEDCLFTAKQIFDNAEKDVTALSDHTLLLDKDGEKLRWFLLPSEAACLLLHKTPSHLPKGLPFTPRDWSLIMNRTDDQEMSQIEVNGNLAEKIASKVSMNGKIAGSDYSTGKNLVSRLQLNCDTKPIKLLNNKKDTVSSPSSKIIESPCLTQITCKRETDSKYQTNENERMPAIMDSKELRQACPLKKTRTTFIEKKMKQSKSDSKIKKIIAESSKPKFVHPPKNIFKPMAEAIEEFSMIKGNDRVLVCLSGGKDSLSLLHSLHQYKYQAKSKGIMFEIGAATVDPKSTAYDPRPLIPYLASLGVPYFFEEQGIIQQASELPACESICSFCSRMKRGRLYACARREGYNVLAMGQHLDDLTESFLMSVFHNGLLRTMKANYTVQEGDLRVIRPLVFVREKDLRQFSEKAKLPVIAENCPACFEAPKERHRTKQLLAAQELLFPDIYSSLLTAMRPLMSKNRVGMESTKMKTAEYDEFL